MNAMSEIPTRPTLTATTAEDVASIRLGGAIDLAYADELQRLGEGLITDHVRTLRIDLSGVNFLDSSGISALIAIRNKAARVGCALILEKPTPNVVRLFEITGLVGDVFTIEPS